MKENLSNYYRSGQRSETKLLSITIFFNIHIEDVLNNILEDNKGLSTEEEEK